MSTRREKIKSESVPARRGDSEEEERGGEEGKRRIEGSNPLLESKELVVRSIIGEDEDELLVLGQALDLLLQLSQAPLELLVLVLQVAQLHLPLRIEGLGGD